MIYLSVQKHITEKIKKYFVNEMEFYLDYVSGYLVFGRFCANLRSKEK